MPNLVVLGQTVFGATEGGGAKFGCAPAPPVGLGVAEPLKRASPRMFYFFYVEIDRCWSNGMSVRRQSGPLAFRLSV